MQIYDCDKPPACQYQTMRSSNRQNFSRSLHSSLPLLTDSFVCYAEVVNLWYSPFPFATPIKQHKENIGIKQSQLNVDVELAVSPDFA